jgi:hypothetical protein
MVAFTREGEVKTGLTSVKPDAPGWRCEVTPRGSRRANLGAAL